MDIEKKNIEGDPENVCTSYDVHTIALVKKNALGINILKAKSEDEPQTEEMKILTEKINKAKAKDDNKLADDADKEVIDKAKSEKPIEDLEDIDSKEESVDKSKSKDNDGDVNKESPEASPEIITDESIEDRGDKVDKSKASHKKEVGKKEDGVDEEDPDDKIDKKKHFSVEELGEAQKSALQAIHALFIKVHDQAPEADSWEVYNLIHDAVFVVDDILWWEAQAKMDEIWDEVWAEVSTRVEKSKALKIKEAQTPSDVMKALESIDPNMAKILSKEIASIKAKSDKSEIEKNAVIRQKALDTGAEVYKRLSTKGNTTDNIVDALSTIQSLAPEAHKVVSKALEVSSKILQAGELFPDVGSSMEMQHQDSSTYIAEKSKALVDAAKEKGETLNPAAARATVRQSPDYIEQYN